MNIKEYIISDRDIRVILKQNGWYTLWSEDNWLQENKSYTNPDWSGISTHDAFNRFKISNEKSDEIIKEYLKNLWK